MKGMLDEVVFWLDTNQLLHRYRGDYVVAVASLNFDPIVAQAAEMFNAGKTITKAEVSGWVKQTFALEILYLFATTLPFNSSPEKEQFGIKSCLTDCRSAAEQSGDFADFWILSAWG